ncbi:hypothetical protein DSCA_48350 [Desulfosarcina alkanivorans]|uniref:Uncharacterized protein n=1 Tax=Desulfosarcina alkanivorans TaxID=571177 RepID=A0A5K7YRG3_9BACT|nr:hypothetical protein DSCA_48350 [Desulfosarcina alkanivorans]
MDKSDYFPEMADLPAALFGIPAGKHIIFQGASADVVMHVIAAQLVDQVAFSLPADGFVQFVVLAALYLTEGKADAGKGGAA